MDEWWRRVYGTAGMVGVAWAGKLLTLPTLHDDQDKLYATIGDVSLLAPGSSGLSVAALGMAPAMTGYGLASIVHLGIPKLRAKLVALNTERPLLRTGFVLTCLFAIVQSAGVALFLQNFAEEFSTIDPINPWIVGPIVAAGAVAHGLFPFAMERWGLLRGLSALVLVHCLLTIADSVYAIVFDFLVNRRTPVLFIDVILVIWVVIATVGAARRFHGETPPLPGAAHVGIASGFAVALLILFTLSNLGLSRLAFLHELGRFGRNMAQLAIAVVGGLGLARGALYNDADVLQRRDKVMPLCSFILFASMVSAFLTRDRLEFPWAEAVVATLLIHSAWRELTWRGPADVEAGDLAAQV